MERRNTIISDNSNHSCADEPISTPSEYSMILRQSPSQGIKVEEGKDKYLRILEPAAIVQVHVPRKKSEIQDFHFAVAVLVDELNFREIHFLEDMKTPILSGSTKSAIHELIDPENDSNIGFSSFLVFPDIYVRKEGAITDAQNPFSKVTKLNEILTESFRIYSGDYGDSKKYNRAVPSIISRSFADQGVRMKLRRQPRSKWVVDFPQFDICSKKRVAAAPGVSKKESEIFPKNLKVDLALREMYPPTPPDKELRKITNCSRHKGKLHHKRSGKIKCIEKGLKLKPSPKSEPEYSKSISTPRAQINPSSKKQALQLSSMNITHKRLTLSENSPAVQYHQENVTFLPPISNLTFADSPTWHHGDPRGWYEYHPYYFPPATYHDAYYYAPGYSGPPYPGYYPHYDYPKN
ncbi:hypothetical protein HDV04_004326 [Boothiomyces sp. JEL0838]|nr:hypothetical protein HDV04_004326 [Boothiomyces sp. JEL0838]